MSRIPKWKVEKTKVKVVFRLQFHATHIPQTGWDKLFVSFIPADTGKPIINKTNKANVRNGSCKWSDPIYETTRLLQDTRTKKYDEKVYKLVVAMGSSRASFLGEVDINLADFADALKPSSVELPLHGCDFGTILHVTVQILTSKVGFREFEQQRELSVKGFQMIPNKKYHDPPEISAHSSDITGEQRDKVNARVKFRGNSMDIPSVEEMSGSIEDYEDSAAGVDGSSYTSDCLYAEKNDISGAHEIESFKGTISDYVGGFSLSQSPRREKEGYRGSSFSNLGSNDWTQGWSSDYSADNDLATAYEENNRLRVRLEVAESAFLQLKSEAKSLQHITDELGAETQTLAQQLAVELTSGEQLVREVSMLKSECSNLKVDLEMLKSAKITQQIPDRRTLMMKSESADPSFCSELGNDVLAVSHPTDHLQVKWLQDVLLIESKVHEIQNKVCVGFRGSDFDFLHSDFEVLECALNNVKQGIDQSHCLEQTVSEHHYMEGRIACITGSHRLYHGHDPLKTKVGAANMTEERICEILQKLEESKTEKEILIKKLDHMECYYEAFIHDLEESQKQTLKEMESLRNEHSSSLYTISVLQAQIEKVHQEMDEQLMRFVKERNAFESQNKELEKRATASEAALKRVRRNYSIAVNRLEKDLELLSFQVLSMYETNETLAKQDFTDAYHICPGEDSEDTQLYSSKDDPLRLFYQKDTYKPDDDQIQSESLCSKTDSELSLKHSSLSENSSNKSATKVCLVVAGKNKELYSRNETCVSANNPTNFLRADSQHINIGMKNLVFSAGLPTHTEGNELLPKRSTAVNFEVDSQPLDCAQEDKQQLNDANDIEEIKMSLHNLLGLCSTMERELSDMHVVTIQQEVFSGVLLETLHNANDEIKHMNNRIIELEQQVDHSNDVRESLVLKFHSALDQAKILREGEAKYVAKYDELTSKNQILEGKLQDVSVENALLTEKFAEYEKLIVENKAYESKYKACIEERNKLENLLVQENLQKGHLQSDIGSMLEDFNALKEEFDRKSSVNDNLQKAITSLQGGLCDLFFDMISCNRQIDNSAFDDVHIQQDFESKNYIAIVAHLKQLHEQACQKILQLHQEKDEMEVMRDNAESALKMSESKIADYEKLIMEYKACESKYKACIEERNKLENLLIEENLQKGHLQSEIVLMIEDLHALKEESLKKSSMGDDLQKAVTSLQGGLHDLCSSIIFYSRQINDLGFDELSLKQELEGKNYMAIVACLENFQKQAYQKILQLHQEKDKTETMKDIAYNSLKMAESKMFDMKKKLECALKDVETKFITKYVDLASENQILEEKLQDVSVENASLTEKFAEYEKLIMEYKDYESKYKASTEERNKLENLLLQENHHKQSEIGSLIEDLDVLKEELDKKSCVIVDLEKTVTSLQGGLNDLCCNMISCNRQINSLASDDLFLNHVPESNNYMAIVTHLKQFHEQTCQKVLQLQRDKKEMEVMKDMAQSSLKMTESMMLNMKQKLESDLESKTTKLDLSNKLIIQLQQELLEVTEKFKIILEAEENHAKENGELSSRLASLEVELQHVTEESRDLVQKLKISDSVNEEHERIKINLMDCKQENRTLMMSIQSRNEASMQLENELRNSKETLRLTHENLQIEKGLREELESALTNLTLQLKEKDHQLLSFNEEKAELVHLKEFFLSLEKENMELQHLLLQNEEIRINLDGHKSSMCLQIYDVENHLATILEDLLVADIEVSFMRSQVQELVSQLKTSSEDLVELHLKYMDAVALVPNGAELVDRNATLVTILQSTKPEAEEVTHYKEGRVDCIKRNSAAWTECGDTEDEAAQADTSKENQKYEDEVLRLKDMLIVLEEQVDDLRSFREELEITNIVLRSKLDEQQSYICLLKVSENELTNLRQQHNELTHKLSEQILKTEEFKNLSVHLRELKDKEDAENLQARERRQNEGQRFVRQDSLRVAFIKEQYESKIQDLRNQLQASKTYAEEMLLKLQNALDEVESGKKNEVCLAKRIEELSMEIADMKTELHTVVTDRRELGKAYDSIKTELECSVLSFNCCKEEKLKLEDSLKECNEERNKISVELDLVKRLLETMVSTEIIQFQGDNGLYISEVTSIEQLLGDGNSLFADVVKEMPNIRGIYCGKGPAIDIDGYNLPNTSFSSSACGEREDIETVSVQEHAFLSSLSISQSSEDSQNRTGRETFMENDRKYDVTVKEHFKEQQRLKIGMNLLLKELERLKNENFSSLLSLEDDLHDPSLNYLERSLSQLDMANEHLRNIFPSFKELPDSSGNALERVLALELELAEALQTKKKTDIRFQSSFLKQHNDEEAVFQSFRDINELIQDMLELKKRHVTVESELKEMQARYSQLSLQFAEVEGERQKLMMTLKNRASRKT